MTLLLLALLAGAPIREFHDIPYGADSRQRFDVYAPANAHGAPVIVMVHGGGWHRDGEEKAASWATSSYPLITGCCRVPIRCSRP